MGAKMVLRRHNAAEIALKNFEIPTLVPSPHLTRRAHSEPDRVVGTIGRRQVAPGST
jgi:hypothetical protein